MKSCIGTLLLCLLCPPVFPVIAAEARGVEVSLASPNERLAIDFHLRDGIPFYGVRFDDKEILVPSQLGLVIDGQAPADRHYRITDMRRSERDLQWKPVYGERDTVRDHFRQLEIDLVDDQHPQSQMTLRLRAYDEGVAFCYHVPEQEGRSEFVISEERTEFRFTGDHRCWPVYSAQGEYQEVTLKDVQPNCERPLVLAPDQGPYLAVGEARLVDYARMRLQPVASKPHTLQVQLDSDVRSQGSLTTPWRFIMVGDSSGQLLERNYLLLNLNDPCAIDDTSWIRPGKVIREVTLTTAGGKACVDFAASHGLQYVEFDAGWYGHEYDEASDATTVTVDPKRSPGPLDLHEVIRYAEARDIGIILYVNRRALEKQLDEILPLYQRWGIKGVKYGFVQVGSQKWTSWLHEAVRKAAKHRLMVDIHDEYRPTGYERTYPNLMTQEGIGGDETSPSNEQTLRNLFTRMLAGAADHTICYYDSRVDRNASHAYQLAKAVCFYSPWQFLYWYDRPSQAGDTHPGAGGEKGVIGNEPELEFFDEVPTVWDETRVIHGRIGRHAVIARRSGRKWFVGAMNNDEPRTLELPLDFLEPGRSYTAHRYRDDPQVNTRTQVRIDRTAVSDQMTLRLDLAPRGGEAIRFTAQSPASSQP